MATLVPFRFALPQLKDIDQSDEFFDSAKRKFPLYLNDGLYRQLPSESLYVYRIQRSHRSHTGIIACTHLEDYLQGRIKAHENTLTEKEQQMRELFRERHAIIKPVLLTYRNVLEIDALLNRITISAPPTFRIEFNDEEHFFWQIDDKPRLQTLLDLFARHVPHCYICDGHHRMYTSEQLYLHQQNNPNPNPNYHYILSAYFAASEIEIHNYNRILLSLKELSEEDFLQRLRSVYQVYATPKPQPPAGKHQLALFLGRQWYKLSLREDVAASLTQLPTKDQLDVSVFNLRVLQEILGIEDVRNEPDVTYVEGPKGSFAMERAVRENNNRGAAFWLYPVSMEDLIDISDAKGTLPPKSTWMEPRMRNGFVVQLYSDL